MDVFILTGGPNSGKTSVLNVLKKSGFCVISESATCVIRDELSIENSFCFPPDTVEKRMLFQKKILVDQLEKLKFSLNLNCDWIFVDRSFVDTLAYLKFENIDFNFLDEIVDEFKAILNSVNIKFFYFELLDISCFENDGVRFEDFDFAKKFDVFLKDFYVGLGLELICVPNDLSISERVDFILERL